MPLLAVIPPVPPSPPPQYLYISSFGILGNIGSIYIIWDDSTRQLGDK